MARLMLSAGMLTDFASAMIVRRRGLVSASPPPFLAATVNSLMMRVKILPRLASAAPFLCLIVCHLEWPDMRNPRKLSKSLEKTQEMTCDPTTRLRVPPNPLPLAREEDPDVGAQVPRAAEIVAEDRVYDESGAFQP